MDPAFTVQDVMGASMSGGGIGEKDPFVNLLWIVCVVATVIVVIVIFLIAIYLIKRSVGVKYFQSFNCTWKQLKWVYSLIVMKQKNFQKGF